MNNTNLSLGRQEKNKESVAGTTINRKEEEERRLDRRTGGSLELPVNNLLKEKEWDP